MPSGPGGRSPVNALKALRLAGLRFQEDGGERR